MGRFDPGEIEAAFEEYRRRAEQEEDWAHWAELFTDDARYVEHCLGTFSGRDAITRWIVEVMAAHPAMTSWIEWHQIEDDHVAFYVWNNLPDPAAEGRHLCSPSPGARSTATGSRPASPTSSRIQRAAADRSTASR